MKFASIAGLCVLAVLAGCAGGSTESSGSSRPAVNRPAYPGPAPAGGHNPGAVDYDIVYVRQPRFGDNQNSKWPEVYRPARIDPGADLMLLHPDGREEVLVDAGNGAVTDPFLTFDARYVLYSYFPDVRRQALNTSRDDLPFEGADIYRLDLQTRAVERLTFQEFTPNTGAGDFDEDDPVDTSDDDVNSLGYGILNLGPCPLPGGRIMFSSNRCGFEPPKGFTAPTLQLYVMDHDGANVTPVAPMNIGSALHPTILRDGRVMFSTYESQGVRDRRVWSIWAIWPDGRRWEPLVSAFKHARAFHFMTQLSDGDLVFVEYYNRNNNGFGSMHRMPARTPAGVPKFYPAHETRNPYIEEANNDGSIGFFRMPFTPFGMYAITSFTHGGDNAAPPGPDGERVGKFTHPSAAPGNDLLAVWTPGPANDLERPENRPFYDGGIYLLPRGDRVYWPGHLVLVKNDPRYNEAWPRAVVPYREIHGVDEPAALPWLPNDGSVHAALPEGTPYGLVGTSSFYRRGSAPGMEGRPGYLGLDAFNTSSDPSSNWVTQGADAGLYTDAAIWAVRLLALEPNTHRSYGPDRDTQYFNHANERMRILGEIPLRKFNGAAPVLDPEGNPDTSFLAKIPADTPFTFQTIDRRGMVLNMAQTWHQVRPGEMRADCGGCHAHGRLPLAFEGTAASRGDYDIPDLRAETPLLTASGTRTVARGVVDVEFVRDIRPILARSCTPCHTRRDSTPPGDLVLDDLATVDGLPGDYFRLAADEDARFGHPSLQSGGRWRGTNASRYVRKFQSRRSLLVWKIHGERLDGWTNAHHPTEAVPGVRSTLPPGADEDDADLDYTGTPMPPPGSGVPALTAEEKLTVVRWIDLGCPIDLGPKGWFLDDLKPTLTVSAPRPGHHAEPVRVLRVGVVDANSGVRSGSLSITADVAVEGRAPGSELADLAVAVGGGIHEIRLSAPLRGIAEARIRAAVADNQGNITRVERRFSVAN